MWDIDLHGGDYDEEGPDWVAVRLVDYEGDGQGFDSSVRGQAEETLPQVAVVRQG